MVTFLNIVIAAFGTVFMGKQVLVLDILALRQQLGVDPLKGKRFLRENPIVQRIGTIGAVAEN